MNLNNSKCTNHMFIYLISIHMMINKIQIVTYLFKLQLQLTILKIFN